MKKLFLFLLLFISTFTLGQTSYFISGADNTKLHVQEFGIGKPIVFLAGGPGLNPIYIKPIWENLSTKYRCIVFDQRGTGESKLASVDSNSVNMKNYVSDLETLRNYLKLDQFIIIGHSWGGMLAMEYAAKHPDKIEKLILLSSGGPTVSFFTYFGDNMEMRLTEEDKKEEILLDSLKQPTLKARWPGYFYDRMRALATKPIDGSELFGQPGVGNFAIKDFISTQNERVSLLKQYKGTAYLLQGRQDPIGESTVFEIRDLIPQLQIHFIERCGHLPWLENDEQVKEFFDLLNNILL